MYDIPESTEAKIAKLQELVNKVKEIEKCSEARDSLLGYAQFQMESEEERNVEGKKTKKKLLDVTKDWSRASKKKNPMLRQMSAGDGEAVVISRDDDRKLIRKPFRITYEKR